MSTNQDHCRFTVSFALLIILSCSCFCMSVEYSGNAAGRGDYLPAVATWYGNPTGSGSGGACGLANDVSSDPYDGFTSAGNKNLFKSGSGCGICYEVKCTGRDNPACSGRPVKVTLTNECPGECNNEPIHFDLSGITFGALANRGQDNNLRNAGRVSLQYRRVKCNYRTNVKFRIDEGSNKYYLAFVVESLNGYGDIAFVEVKPSNANWMAAQIVYGVTFKFDVLEGLRGPYSIRITRPENRRSITAVNVIPDNWRAGSFYYSNVNF